MNHEPMRVVGKCVEEELQRLAVLRGAREMPRQREPAAPVLRALGDVAFAQIDEASRCSKGPIRALQALERQVRAIGQCPHERFPRVDRALKLALRESRVAQVEMRGHRASIDVERFLKRSRRSRAVPSARLRAPDLVAKEPEYLQMLLAVP